MHLGDGHETDYRSVSSGHLDRHDPGYRFVGVSMTLKRNPLNGAKIRLFRMHRHHHASGRRILPLSVKEWLASQTPETGRKVAYALLTHPIGVWIDNETSLIYRYDEGPHDMVVFGGSQ
jgi:hypothetical protein